MNEFYLFLVGAIAVLFTLTLTQVVFSLLKSRHREKWEELGKPHVIFNNVPFQTVRWMRFLRKREYKQLDDVAIRRLSKAIIGLSLLIPVWLILMLWVVMSK